MNEFTSGKFAKGHCDRCGQRYYLNKLKLEWTGLKVCKSCFDPQDSLEFPTHFPVDPEALENPRPDIDVEAGEGIIRTPNRVGSGFPGIELEVQVGDVTVTVA